VYGVLPSFVRVRTGLAEYPVQGPETAAVPAGGFQLERLPHVPEALANAQKCLVVSGANLPAHGVLAGHFYACRRLRAPLEQSVDVLAGPTFCFQFGARSPLFFRPARTLCWGITAMLQTRLPTSFSTIGGARPRACAAVHPTSRRSPYCRGLAWLAISGTSLRSATRGLVRIARWIAVSQLAQGGLESTALRSLAISGVPWRLAHPRQALTGVVGQWFFLSFNGRSAG
jgi:hypothetical protein